MIIDKTLEELEIPLLDMNIPEYVWGSMNLWEVPSFCSIIKHLNPKSYFEFGTGSGVSYENVRKICPDCAIWSVDDHKYKQYSLTVRDPNAFFIVGNSLTLRFSHQLCHAMDVVLVDADHQLVSVANDTGRAMDLVKPGGYIIWHDVHDLYGVQVQDFFEKWFNRDIIRIKGTTIGLYHVES